MSTRKYGESAELINRDEMLLSLASSGVLHIKLSEWCFKSNLTAGSDNYIQIRKKMPNCHFPNSSLVI